MDRVELALRLFFCLPFAHSEDISDRDLSVRLNAALAAVAGEATMLSDLQHRPHSFFPILAGMPPIPFPLASGTGSHDGGLAASPAGCRPRM